MSDADQLLSTWLDRVARLEATEDVEGDAMKAVALELGLTESDLARVEEAVADHLTRGRNFTRHGRPAEGVDELEQARALAPWRFDVLHALAEAQVARYEGQRTPAHRAAAEAGIRACVAREPDHEPSYALLSRLDAPPARSGPPTSGGGRAQIMMIIGGVLVMTMVLATIALIGNSSDGPPAAEQPPPQSGSTTPPADPLSLPATADQPASETPPPAEPSSPPPRGKYALPVAQAGDWRGVVIEGEQSEIERNSVATYARIKLRARNDGDQMIDDLQVRIELLDAAGQVVTAATEAMINSAYTPMRPGHTEVFGKHMRTEARAVSARVLPAHLSAGAPGQPLQADPVCLRWGIDAPETVPFAVVRLAERRESISLTQDFAFTNTSGARIDNLNVRVEHLDADGNPLKKPSLLDEELVASTWKPSWEPGEVRRVRHHKVMGRDQQAARQQTCLRVLTLH